MKWKITYTIDTKLPKSGPGPRTLESHASAADLMQHLRYAFESDSMHILIEEADAELDKKVSDLTLKELFEILDVTADLAGQNRRQQEEIQERVKALLEATIDMEKVRAHGVAVQTMRSSSELQELFNEFDKDFVKVPYAGCKKLLLLYAWAQE